MMWKLLSYLMVSHLLLPTFNVDVAMTTYNVDVAMTTFILFG